MTNHPFVASPGNKCSSCNKLKSDSIHTPWNKSKFSQEQINALARVEVEEVYDQPMVPLGYSSFNPKTGKTTMRTKI